ncbi:MAG: NAD-dependent aldehyde dehydrogenase, partial [Bradymonadaceae bacterium]
CGIMGETQLAGDTPAAFLERAVDFCNETLWGTLNVCVIVHPETRRALGEALERAVARLQYGNIVLNHWPALSFSLGTTPWGAHPGHTRRDIQSGAGFVHNARLFERPLKSVLDGPFRMYPEPPWFVTNDAAPSLAPALAEFEAAPGPMKLLGILGASLG